MSLPVAVSGGTEPTKVPLKLGVSTICAGHLVLLMLGVWMEGLHLWQT